MGSYSKRLLLLVAVAAGAEFAVVLVASLLRGFDLVLVILPSLLPATVLIAVVAVSLARRRRSLSDAGAGVPGEAPADLSGRIGIGSVGTPLPASVGRAAWRRSLR